MLLRYRSLAFILFSLVAAVPARADLIVAPNANTAAEGSTLAGAPFSTAAFTFQWVFDDSQFASIPLGSKITGIGFRLDACTFACASNPATSFAQWDLQISQSLNAPGSLSGTYADNIAGDVVLVRSGPLALAANSFTAGPGPNPFTTIAFTLPYTYVGGDLLLTLRHTAAVTGGNFALDAIGAASAITDSAGTPNDSSATAVANNCGGPCVHFFFVPVTELVFERAAAPAPATLALLGLGLAGLGWSRRRK